MVKPLSVIRESKTRVTNCPTMNDFLITDKYI
jgi:hypothetical protein